MEAQVYAVYELIRQTGDHGYDRLDNYALIFWDQSSSRVIELEFLLGNSISQFGSEGTDQNGYGWIVRRCHGFCACRTGKRLSHILLLVTPNLSIFRNFSDGCSRP